MVDRNSIMSYDVCTCGAITLYLSNKTQVSLKRKNLKKIGLSLKGIAKETRGKLINCNHLFPPFSESSIDSSKPTLTNRFK